MKHIAIVALTLMVSACSTTKTTPIDEASTLEGLQRVEVKGIDAVFRKPGADYSQYSKIMVYAPQIAFSKNFGDTSGSVLHNMAKPDREKIKTDLTKAFVDVIKRELETEGGYKLVIEEGPDVLAFQPAIVNLYVTAPDVSMQTAGRVKTYTTNAGEMTLVAEFRDSITNELLTRVYDRQAGMDSGTWEWTTSVSNGAEARRIIGNWAKTMRRALDAAHGKPVK